MRVKNIINLLLSSMSLLINLWHIDDEIALFMREEIRLFISVKSVQYYEERVQQFESKLFSLGNS